MVVAREPVVFLFFGAVLILAPPHSFCLLPPEQVKILHSNNFEILVHGYQTYIPHDQVHIALGETSSEMSVSWVTQIGSDDPEVQYGLTQNQLNMTSYGYSKILHDQGEAKRNFTINVGVMTGLSPRQRYYCKFEFSVFTVSTHDHTRLTPVIACNVINYMILLECIKSHVVHAPYLSHR
jgi:hypothetical protein